MIFAGIGSRSTPDSVLALIAQFAAFMGIHGHTLRTGGAQGQTVHLWEDVWG